MYSADIYKMVVGSHGKTLRERHVSYLKRDVQNLAPDNPAYKQVVINGESKFVTITSKDNYHIKEIVSMPGERIANGSMVIFCDAPWLVTTTDLDDEIYSKGLMYLCNCKLRWHGRNGEYYCYDGFAEDATKYSEGVESTQYLRIAEFQIKVKIPVDAVSATICRDMRFVIDAEKYVDGIIEAEDRPFVFKVTRRNIVTGTHEDEGYVEITLVQDQWIEGKDNQYDLVAAQPYELKRTYPSPDHCPPRDESKGGWL